MTHEEKFRRGIDRQLELCGWLIQDADEMKAYQGQDPRPGAVAIASMEVACP